MNIFIIGSRFAYPETMSLFLDNAFKSLGHTTGGYCERTDRYWGELFGTVQGVRGLEPDLFIVIKGVGIDTNMPSKMKARYKCKTVMYFPDPLEDQDNRKYIEMVRKKYDHLFLACWYPDKILEELNAHFLPVGYDPDIHKPDPITPLIRREVVFVGTRRTGREWIPKVPNISIFGNEWNSNTKDVYLNEKVLIYQGAKIVLNQHFLGKGLNHRFYETLAIGGGLLLSDLYDGIVDSGFISDKDFAYKDFAYYETPEDAIEKVAYYLDHPEVADQIKKRGMETVKPHTFQARVKKLLEVVT